MALVLAEGVTVPRAKGRQGWRRRPYGAWCALLLAAGLGGPACQQDLDFPGQPQVVSVRMRDYGFYLDSPSRAARTVFTARNEGRQPHEMVLVALPEDFPPMAEQLRGETRRAVDTVATVPERRPRASGAFAVDLEPGRYALLCFVTDPDGRQHAQKGMSAEFRVA